MRAVGVQANLPDPDTLARAENPPAADWRHPIEMQPRHPFIRRAPDRFDAGVARVAAIHGAVDAATRWRDPVRAAEAEARAAAEFDARRVLINRDEYEDGQRLAAKWRPVLDALGDILDFAEERIPDLYLAAIPEEELRGIAAEVAEIWRSSVGGTLRQCCPDHQLRQLRKAAAAARVDAGALFGTVGKGGADYTDNFSLARWRERQARAAAFGARRVLVVLGQEGPKAITLDEVMRTAQKGALARTYKQHLGLDEVAREDGLTAIFLTITLPPEWHPNPTKGRNRWTTARMPRMADEALANLWAKFRARLHRKHITPYGLRVTEPHKDGCPHLHALIYVRSEDVATVDQALRRTNPERTRDGKRRATRLEVIDTTRASAPTYVLKYLMKARNDGEAAAQAAGRESEDGDHLAQHDRVRAWASERRLRRFAWVGLHGSQRAWQAVHSRKAIPADAPDQIHHAHAAMKAGKNGEALIEMGAIRGRGRAPVRLTYEDRVNSYGEPVRRPVGITVEGTDWTMPLKGKPTRVLTLDDWQKEQNSEEEEDYVTMCKRLRAEELADREARRTIAVSFPRGPNDDCPEGEAGGRTGPPPQNLHILHNEIYENHINKTR